MPEVRACDRTPMRLQEDLPRFGTTIPPFEGATFSGAWLNLTLYTRERESARQAVNDWIRSSAEFDAVVDFDEVLRDPSRPTRLLPAYASEDHLHVNDAGNVTQGDAISLALFRTHN